MDPQLGGLQIRTFGGLGVTVDGAPVAPVEARAAEALLVYLAHADGPTPRDELAHLLWPARPLDTARTNLRSAIHRLWRVLPGHVDATRTTVQIRGASTDKRAFEASVRARSLADAIRTYRGEFLAGFCVDGSPGFEAWQAAEAERYRTLAIAAPQELVVEALASGTFDDALDHARRLIAIDPLHEPAHRAVARSLVGTGRRAAALAQLTSFARDLASELGLEPEPATRRLLDEIRSAVDDRDASGAGPGAPGPSPVAGNVARRRERDCRRPGGAAPGRGPPHVRRTVPRTTLGARPGRATPRRPGLPLAHDPGSWRRRQARLAVEAASALSASFDDGVCFVGLSGVRAADLVVRAVAAELPLGPLPAQDPARQVASYLRDKELLLVVDNVEHLADAAPTLAELVRRAPRVTVVATSRVRLHLGEEWLLPLEGLADAADAERLFTAHARRVAPEWDAAQHHDTVQQLCALVGCLPLALELAAAWVHAVPPARIVHALSTDGALLRAPRRAAPERHHSVGEMFDASWALLSNRSKDVLANLAIFRGGFTHAEAERVADARLDELLALVDHSLVRSGQDGRFELHELIRQCAHARLRDRGDLDMVARRHLHTYLDVARAAGPRLLGSGLEAGLDRFRAESGNLRAAVDWALSRPEDVDDGLALVLALEPWWRLSCAIEEARSVLARAESLIELAQHRAAAIRSVRGHFAWMAQVVEEAEAILGDCVDAWDAGTPEGRLGRGRTLTSLAMTAWTDRRLEQALQRATAAIELLNVDDHP